MNEIEYGFYWVKMKYGGDVTIGEYINDKDGDDFWLVIGINDTYYTNELEVLVKVQ